MSDLFKAILFEVFYQFHIFDEGNPQDRKYYYGAFNSLTDEHWHFTSIMLGNDAQMIEEYANSLLQQGA